MGFTKTANATEIPPGKMKAIKINGKDILLANVEGKIYAIANQCTHAHAPLSRGKLDGCVVTCPLHGARFDITSGKNLSDAKILFLKMKANDSHSYPVKIEGTDVFVDIG
ncbi:MAG TPA: non-heme iron oxygenase ferredoxin subunit [Oculatellaceae cyanobacterium]